MNDHSYLIPTPDGAQLPHPLGRHVHHDPRNANWRALVKPPPRAVKPYRAWPSSVVWDQGNSSRCTEEAATGLLRTAPFSSTFTGRSKFYTTDQREAAYLRWQQYDPWAGTPHDGSSTDAPFQGLRAEGEIESWHWLFGEAEVREYVTWYGPVVVGTEWLQQMFYPSLSGYLQVAGQVAGGHAYRLVQYSKTHDAYRMVNSWGRGWGDNGRAWLRSGDLATLLAADGDAVTL